MKKVQKRVLVAMISATAFFAGFANAADDETKSSGNPNKFNKGVGSSASALFAGNVFDKKSGDPERTKQQLLKQQLANKSLEKEDKTKQPPIPNKKAAKKGKKSRFWGKKVYDSTDGGRTASDIRSSGGPDYSDASGSESSDGEDITSQMGSMSLADLKKGYTPTKKQPTNKAQSQHQKEKTPQVSEGLVKQIAANLALMFTNKADHKENEDQQLENSFELGEEMAKDPLNVRFKDITEKLLTRNGKKIDTINPHEDRLLAVLDDRPVSVKAQMVNVGNDKKVEISILPIRDKFLAGMFEETKLKNLGKTAGYQERGDIYEAISTGEITYPLAQEKLHSAFTKALEDKGSIETRVFLNPEDMSDATEEAPQIGPYADQAIYQNTKQGIAIKYLHQSLADKLKDLDEYKKKDAEYKQTKQEIAHKDQMIVDLGKNYKAQKDKADKANDNARKLRAQLRKATDLANKAHPANLQIGANHLPDIQDQDLRGDGPYTMKDQTKSWDSGDEGT